MNTKKIKRILRSPYAWPGGREIFFITHDGCLLCHDCARKNFRNILDSTKNKIEDGWWITGYCIEAADPESTKEVDESLLSYCQDCSKEVGELD